MTAECIFRFVRSPFYFSAPLRRGLFRTGARLKQLLQPVQQRYERYKNAADPISLAKSNNMMRRTRRPMLAIRFQEDDLLIVLNGSPSIPICNMLFDRH
jgi:hypothetical protein